MASLATLKGAAWWSDGVQARLESGERGQMGTRTEPLGASFQEGGPPGAGERAEGRGGRG